MRSPEDVLNDLHALVHEMADLIRGLEPEPQPPVLATIEVVPTEPLFVGCARCQAKSRPFVHVVNTWKLYARQYDGALMGECPSCHSNSMLSPGDQRMLDEFLRQNGFRFQEDIAKARA